MIPSKPFYFMRHGQTEFNLQNRCMGSLDIPLNETGERQAFEALEKLKGLCITNIVSSPLKRALRTAEIVSAHLNLSVSLTDDLKEANWGDQEGRPKADLSLFSRWRHGLSFNNGESFDDVKARAARVLNQYLHKDGLPLFVSHGGIYWSILELLRLPFDDAHNCDVFYFAPVSEGSDDWVCGRI